jgi:adenylate kinase family enzyme
VSAGRIAIIGNAGGGKSTLARAMAARRGLPLTEVDKLLWLPGWQLSPDDLYEAQHAPLIAGERWLIEGMGRLETIRDRLLRATWVFVVDMPIWMHFWLAAERQIAWAKDKLDHPPAGLDDMISTEDMFRTLWETEQEWMPTIRANIDEAEAAGIEVTRIASVDELDAFAEAECVT